MAVPTTSLKPFKKNEFFSDDKNRVKEFMNKPGVRDKIWQMSQKYGVSPNEIVYSIYKESAGSFSPQQPGSKSSAIGLFQIMPEFKGANYRDFISYEPWGEGLENTEQWRMKGGTEWGKFPLVPGEQYSSKSGKGYQKGKRRFYMDDIAKMNELQQLELFDLYLGEKFRGSDYREGNVSKGGPGDIYTSVAWPDAIGVPGNETVIEKGTEAYEDNRGWRSGLLKTGNITPNSIRKFGGNQEVWDNINNKMFSNEALGYNENYVPVEDPYPYPQFTFNDEGRVTFDSKPKPEPESQPKPQQNTSESVIDYSEFKLPSFESDNTRVDPFPQVPVPSGSWDMFMESYNKSGLPAEGFARGGQVIKNNDMKYNNYKYGGMHYGVPQYFLGGAFEKLTGKKFKDTGFGKGLRDFGVATLNTAASPLESLMGTDFGIDEKFGYKTKFGDVFGGIGETAGSMLGQLAPTALNTIAPGAGTALSMVGQSFGSGLEGAGITQDISTDPQSSMGSQFGGMLNMMAMMNPEGGAGQFTQNLGQSGFMQGLGALFSGQNAGMKHGGMNYKYGQGGMAQQADVEVESGEVVQTEGGAPRSYNPKAPLKSIGANGFKVQGKESHAKGGVAMTMPNGENRVYAKKNAAEAEKLLKLIAQAQKNAQSSDFITRATAELDVKKYTRQLDDRFEQQQKENGNQTNMTTDMAKNGLWANIHAKRKRIAGGSGERMRTPGSKGAPTNEAIKNSQARYGMQYMKAKHGMQHTKPPREWPSWAAYLNSRDAGLEPAVDSVNISNQMWSLLRDVPTGYVPETGSRNVPAEYFQSGESPQYNIPDSLMMGRRFGGNPQSGGSPQPELGGCWGGNCFPELKKGGLVKAQNGLQYNPNFGSSIGSGSNFGIPGFSSTPGANTFNTLYSSGTGGSGFGGLQTNTPSQYEQVPFESQYSGMKGILPYASSLMNLGIGLKGLKDPGSFDASKYMINPELKNTQLDKNAMIAPDMQAYTSALNSVQDPRYKTMIHSNFMPQLAKRSEGIEFLQQKLEGENVDTINKFKGLNARTQYGIDMKNAELAALPYQFLGQAASDITSTSQQMGQNKGMEQMLHHMFPQYRKVNS